MAVMSLLMVLISLAFNTVATDKVIPDVLCRSTSYCLINRCYYTTRSCTILGISTDTPVAISLKQDYTSWKCKPNQSYYLQKDTRRLVYKVVVKGGCYGRFEVRIQDQAKPLNNSLQCGISISSRIINGHQASVCQFPWMVWIYNSHAATACGGSILDESHILTAAHCVIKPRSSHSYTVDAFYIYSGSSRIPTKTFNNNPTLRERYVSTITVHAKFNNLTLANDIAIMKLVSPIKFDACHAPICLINGSLDIHKAKNCIVMGWGYTSDTVGAQVEEYLRWVGQKPVPNTACADEYNLNLYQDKTFCASGIGNDGSDSCLGDSGGPFICQEADGRYYQYGLVSAGNLSHKCGMGHGLYTKVGSFLDWIAKKLQ